MFGGSSGQSLPPTDSHALGVRTIEEAASIFPQAKPYFWGLVIQIISTFVQPLQFQRHAFYVHYLQFCVPASRFEALACTSVL